MPTSSPALTSHDQEQEGRDGRPTVGLAASLAFTLSVAVVFDTAIRLAVLPAPTHVRAIHERPDRQIRIISSRH